MKNWKVIGAALATLLISGTVLAQRELQMFANTVLGQQEVLLVGSTTDTPPNSITVKVDANGRLLTNSSASTPAGAAAGTHGVCTMTVMNVGTTGTACPTTPRADRASVLWQLNQTGETLRVALDGTTATATNGLAVASGATLPDNLAGTVATSCRCTAATCEVVIVECP